MIQDMSRALQMQPDITYPKRLPESHGFDQLQTALGGSPIIQRLRIWVFAQFVANIVFGVLFLNMAAVRQ